MSDITRIFGGPLRLESAVQCDPPEVQLQQAMASAGITAPAHFDFDGEVHRFNNGKKKDKSAWYIAFNDGIAAGAFGDWREGISQTWRADIGRALTLAEQMANSKRMAELKAIREREMQQKRDNAAQTAWEIWSTSDLAPQDHPYLVAKQIDAAGLHVTKDSKLIAPVYINGDLSSVQYISENGQKKFLTGGAITNGYCAFGQVSNKVYICEGIATAKSIHKATGHRVYAAFSASNLINVASYVRRLYGIAVYTTIVADNDESGTGEREGRKAAEAIQAAFVNAPITGDANDYLNAGHDLRELLEGVKPHLTFNMISFADILTDTKPLKWIIKGIMPQDSLMMIHGPSGGGKSFVALDMAMAIATGKTEWCGHKVHAGPIAYLAGEGHHGIKLRLQAWARHHKTTQADFWLSDRGTDLNTPEGFREVVEALQQCPKSPSAIFIDTLHRFLAGDENSAQDAKTMIDACAELSRMFNCTIILVHHTGVSEEAQHRARGSSAWRGALDAEMSVVPPKDGIIQLIQRKQKDAELAQDIYMRLERIEFGTTDEDGDPIGSAVAVQVHASEIKPAMDDETTKAQSILIDVAKAHGSIVQDQVYVTNDGFTKWSKGQDWQSDDQRKKKVQRIKSKLIAAGIIIQNEVGFRVQDEAISGVVRVLFDLRGKGY